MEQDNQALVNDEANPRISDVYKDEDEQQCDPKKMRLLSYILIGIACALVLTLIILLATADFSKDKNEEEDEPEEEKWEPKGEKIKTDYAQKITPKNVWPEYPRPQLERTNNNWINLNGLWNYNIVPKGSLLPEEPDGKILVPFPIESSLSGVMRNVTEEDEIWYKKDFELPRDWDDDNLVYINFGAVDWQCEVYLNGEHVGSHTGGYAPFSLDITNQILYKGINILLVKVYDPTNAGYQPVGKQSLNPSGVYYTASSGIWQTVWIETLNRHHISRLTIIPDYDRKTVLINPFVDTKIPLNAEVSIFYKDEKIHTFNGKISQDYVFTLTESQFHSWTPETPELYDIKVIVYAINEKIADEVKSYFAFRKVTKEQEDAIYRIKLNDKVYFSLGVLDQGFWPDGLYTPPSEEAVIYDLTTFKSLGFNTLRKHMKVESARFYYQCDKLGILVWQDMPSGDPNVNMNRTEESKQDFYNEWEEILDNFSHFPSIIIWVPFNEGWGQFDTCAIADFTKNKDSTRLVDPASGGNYDELCQDFFDLHTYPEPKFERQEFDYINVIGEYGSLGYKAEGHIWQEECSSYEMFNTTEELTNTYVEYTGKLVDLKDQGISGAIVTQAVDVEGETNGLLTYDRQMIKCPVEKIKEVNERVINH